MSEEELKIQLSKLKDKIPFDKDIFENTNTWESVLIDLLNDSKDIALSVLYPYEDYSDYPLPKKYYNWQLRCCVELYNMADKQGYTNYTENSLSWTKMSDGLSKFLMTKLTSKVGVPKSNDSEE